MFNVKNAVQIQNKHFFKICLILIKICVIGNFFIIYIKHKYINLEIRLFYTCGTSYYFVFFCSNN